MVIQERMCMHTKDNSDLDPNTMAKGGVPVPLLSPAHCSAELLVFYKGTSPAIYKNAVCASLAARLVQIPHIREKIDPVGAYWITHIVKRPPWLMRPILFFVWRGGWLLHPSLSLPAPLCDLLPQPHPLWMLFLFVKNRISFAKENVMFPL